MSGFSDQGTDVRCQVSGAKFYGSGFSEKAVGGHVNGERLKVGKKFFEDVLSLSVTFLNN